MDGQNLETIERVGEAALGAIAQSSNPTITSGIARLQAVVSGAGSIIGEIETLVGSMTGEAKAPTASGAASAGAGSASSIHDAAAALEGLFGQIAGLVKRARAAHG